MKNRRIRIISALLSLVLLIGVIALYLPQDVKAADVTKYSYKGNTPFFNGYMDNSYTLNNDASIDQFFDTLPPTTNTSNFCSLATTSYPNINGKTVTVDTFARVYNESLNDPNFAEGLLIYQCIQYKVRHPEEEVSLYYSSYRTSITASVCVDRNSKFFGYMRSLFDCEYDNHGFIRISFMLVEAARMGIHVTILPQLNSYARKQYSATTSNHLASKSIVPYEPYFTDALNKSCYTQYANGKKVSDFMNYKKVEWPISEVATEMHHIKTCIASNYVDKDGVEHGPAVFLTSANLDENDYLGRNGNNGMQTGVIVTEHDDLYRVTKNYLDKIAEYSGKNDSILFKDYVYRTQTAQADLILAGRGNEIDPAEQLIYLGSDSDNVFEMYFTPLPGPVSVWSTRYNPYCKYITEMAQSSGPKIFTWNVAKSENSNDFNYTFDDILCEAFHKNKNKENRIFMHFLAMNGSKYNDLVVGRDIGFRSVNESVPAVHSKDVLMRYEKDGAKKYVSIINSCNFHSTALFYQSNHILVIKETEENHGVFTSLGLKTTHGAIRETD